MIHEFHISGYRSIRDFRYQFGRVNVVVGPNGCGKTNLYRGLKLVAAAAEGRLSQTLAEEGGMPSVLWAGARRKGSVRLTLEVTTEALSYSLSCGLPTPNEPDSKSPSFFTLDPLVKEESVSLNDASARGELLTRTNATAWARNADGNRVTFPMMLSTSESVLSELSEPQQFPYLASLRHEFLSWRFYHHFRTDQDSPIRHPQIGIRTPVLYHDGRDLAACLQTIIEMSDESAIRQAIDDAFPGAQLVIEEANTRFSLLLHMPSFQRPFTALELSDGTLRYLCLIAVLLSPRPPRLLAINEPEMSVHPNLMDALARLIVKASRDSQVWVTTHSQQLANSIEKECGCRPIQLTMVDGETRVVVQ